MTATPPDPWETLRPGRDDPARNGRPTRGDVRDTRLGRRLPDAGRPGLPDPADTLPSGTETTRPPEPGTADTLPRGAETARPFDAGTAETQLRDPGTATTRPPDPGTAETQLRDPGTATTRPPGTGTAETQGREASGPDADGVRRFGPGVTVPPGWTPAPPKPRRRRPASVALLLGWIALALALAYVLFWPSDPLVLAGAEVAPAVPPGAACDVTVDVVGTIHTNGKAGTIEYRWLRSDGETTATMNQTVEDGRSVVQVHLFWTISGPGRYPATATLEITRPQPLTAAGTFTYSCR